MSDFVHLYDEIQHLKQLAAVIFLIFFFNFGYCIRSIIENLEI